MSPQKTVLPKSTPIHPDLRRAALASARAQLSWLRPATRIGLALGGVLIVMACAGWPAPIGQVQSTLPLGLELCLIALAAGWYTRPLRRLAAEPTNASLRTAFARQARLCPIAVGFAALHSATRLLWSLAS